MLSFNNKKRSIPVLGGSIVKDVKPFKMRRMMNKNERLYVKCFPGASIDDMLDYGKPSLIRRNPEVIIYHAGTNSLRTEDEPRQIVNDIITETKGMKSESNEIFISSIVTRNDKYNDKGSEVNELLKLQCSKLDLGYIDNSNITNDCLNKSGIHLTLHSFFNVYFSLHNQIQSTWRKYYLMSYLLFLLHSLRNPYRKADKPKLAEGIEKFVKEHSSTDKSESTLYITDETLIDSKVENCDKEKQVHGTTTTTDSHGDSNHHYVLDGGSLLHLICWA